MIDEFEISRFEIMREIIKLTTNSLQIVRRCPIKSFACFGNYELYKELFSKLLLLLSSSLFFSLSLVLWQISWYRCNAFIELRIVLICIRLSSDKETPAGKSIGNLSLLYKVLEIPHTILHNCRILMEILAWDRSLFLIALLCIQALIAMSSSWIRYLLWSFKNILKQVKHYRSISIYNRDSCNWNSKRERERLKERERDTSMRVVISFQAHFGLAD